MRRGARVFIYGALGLAALVLLAAGTVLIVVQTDWFKNKVRERIVAVAEKATGGRVEIGKFNYNWRALTAEVAPFIVHGSEPAHTAPFFRAEKIEIGLNIISPFQRQVDIASLIVDKPQLHVIVAPDGSTNVPRPQVPRSKKTLAEEFLDLKVRHFELRDGWADYNSRRLPLNLRGDRLGASLGYDATGARYLGQLSCARLWASAPSVPNPLVLELNSKIAFEANSLQVIETTVVAGRSKITVRGSIINFSSPRGALDIAGSAPVNDLRTIFRLPFESPGDLSFQGRGTLDSNPFGYKVEGRLTGRGLAYADKNVTIRDISLATQLEMTDRSMNLRSLEVSAIPGKFRGAARIDDFERIAVNGTLQDVSLKELASVDRQNTGTLTGSANGSVMLHALWTRSGLQNTTLESHLDLAAGAGGVPLQGAITVRYDQRAGKIQLPEAEVNLGSTHVTASGTLGGTLDMEVVSKNLNDALPALPLLGISLRGPLPVALQGSSARFAGFIQGPLANPRISGKAESGRLTFDHQEFDRVTTSFDWNRSAVDVHSFTLQQGKMRVEGQGSAALRDWKLQNASSISGLVSVREGDVGALASENKIDLPVTGTLAAELRVGGSLDSPLVTGNFDLHNVTAFEEHLDSARGNVTLTPTGVEIEEGEARLGPARITMRGAYNHVANAWTDGSVRFQVASSGLTLAQIGHAQSLRDRLAAQVDVEAAGSAKLVRGIVDLTSLNGELRLRNAVVDGRPYGDLELTATTRLPVLDVSARVNLGGIRMQGNGEWRMEGDYPGEAHIEIPRVPFATLHALTPGEHLRKDLPFDGFVQGEAMLRGPLNNPSAMKADVTLSSVEVRANPSVRPLPAAQASDLVLRNAQPVLLQATTKSIDIHSARFVATDTTLEASGRLALDSKSPWDANVEGRINLSILRIFNPDLLASGASVIRIAVRGSFTDPDVDGRLELMNASLFPRDFPNGVDQANGLILFDRNRATVQSLRAVTGGGAVTFQSGSFIGFRGGGLLYGIQANASNVRYRSEDGVSVTADAALSLTGTSENSLLSGSVRVIRAAFSPRTDVGALLASTARPTAVSTQNEYLQGMQLDVQVTAARNLEVETALTRNIELDTNLRLRGTPQQPVVLGKVSINSGQIEFFGNKYTINRGEINFYNAARIEPTLDMDLETQVRGIAVDISFTGPLNKLNFSYRSDPPLQANDIIALLAVGRAPSTTGALTPSQLSTNTSYMPTGTNSLLEQAIAPQSGRLQKFFGVSHIKLDPQLTDITTIPQARLSFEQQISADITLTYITNLEVTNQQLVRVEWDLNRKWSVVALRDENGAFSVDFQYRKRFK